MLGIYRSGSRDEQQVSVILRCGNISIRNKLSANGVREVFVGMNTQPWDTTGYHAAMQTTLTALVENHIVAL